MTRTVPPDGAVCPVCGGADLEWSSRDDAWLCAEHVAPAVRASARNNGAAAAQPVAGDAAALCVSLTADLGLGTVGLSVVGAEVFGRGPDAKVDVRLSTGRPLRFERFADVARPAALAAHLVTQTGVHKSFKGDEAGTVAATVFRLARHHDDADDDEAAREWGAEWLRVAKPLVADLTDQADRWRAFSTLAEVNPAHDAGEDRSAHALAAASFLLVDRNTTNRLVRTGWFQAFVKREVGGLYSPAALAALMERVGWRRAGTEGRVKATSPNDQRRLQWSFYIVSPGWEDTQVTAGHSSNTRVRAYARPVGTPAVTRDLVDEA